MGESYEDKPLQSWHSNSRLMLYYYIISDFKVMGAMNFINLKSQNNAANILDFGLSFCSKTALLLLLPP